MHGRDDRAGRPGPGEPAAGPQAAADAGPRRRRDPRPRRRCVRSRSWSTTSSGPTTTACGCSGTSSAPTPRTRSSCCSRSAPRSSRSRPRPSTWSPTWSAWGSFGACGCAASASPRPTRSCSSSSAATLNATSAAAMHAQSEGVPFIVEEMAHAYRDGGHDPGDRRRLDALRQRRAPRSLRRQDADLAPRGAPAQGHEGRARRGRRARSSFQPEGPPRDRAPGGRPNDQPRGPRRIARAGRRRRSARRARRAVAPADYSFPHDQIREFASAGLSAPRRRRSTSRSSTCCWLGEPSPASLPLLAHHAKAAGDAEVCVKFSLEATRARPRGQRPRGGPARRRRGAPVRGRPAGAGQAARGSRPGPRDAAASGRSPPGPRRAVRAGRGPRGPRARARRSPAPRGGATACRRRGERAATLAREVRDLAAERGDRRAELAACIELGQVLLQSPLGEGVLADPAGVRPRRGGGGVPARGRAGPRPGRRREPRRRAPRDRRGRSSAGIRDVVRRSRSTPGEHLPYVRRVAAGEAIDDMLGELPIAPAGRGGGRAVPGGARAVRTARRPARRDVHDHRDGLPELGRRTSTSDRTRPNTSRRSGGIVVHDEDVHERERARGVRRADALRRPPVRPRQGHPRPRDLPRRGGVRAGAVASGTGRSSSCPPAGPRSRSRTSARWSRRWSGSTGRPRPRSRARRRSEPGGSSPGAGSRTLAPAMPSRCVHHLERAADLAAERGHPAARCEALAQLALAAARLGAEQDDRRAPRGCGAVRASGGRARPRSARPSAVGRRGRRRPRPGGAGPR